MSQERDITTTEESLDQSSEMAQAALSSPFQSHNVEAAGNGPFAKLIAPEGVRGLFLISFVDLEVIFN